ncbi:MAG: DUF4340 domain-containing protein, partial [Candidatus Sumerlaeaceae bacterium]|nr:DUF4340 domain-containing protein [Candidatus Sumerlaeaceae bacterium]
VSTNPKNFGEFEVDETSATHVQLFGKDKSLADLYIGKAGPSFMSTFIRKAGNDEVVDAKASLGFAFKKPEGWRDTQILDIPVDEIVGISAEGTSSTWELKKTDGNWNVVKPVQKTAQSMKAQSLSTALSVLRSTGFVEKESTKTLTQLGLDPPKQKYTITHEDRTTSPAKEQTTVLLVGEMEGPSKSYFVKRADRDDLYTIAEFQANALAATLDQLVPPEPKPAPAPETTATVEASAPAKPVETTPTVEAASVTSKTK